MIAISGLTPKQYRVTPEGMNELKRLLKSLARKRKKAVSGLREISSQSNNLGAQEDSMVALHKNQLIEMDSQIERVKLIISLAQVIKSPSNNKVQVGSRVSVLMDKIVRYFTLVSSLEADPTIGKISEESPFGKALLGKKVGDQVETLGRTNKPRKSAVIHAIN